MINRFQGDPKLILTDDGVTINFVAGNPVMDQGVENLALISLLTLPGWWGNDIFQNPDEQIGSDFEEIAKGPITLSKLNDIKQSAESALANPAFGNIETTVINPVSDQVHVINRIEPPGQDAQELLLTRNGQNWINQANKELS